MSMLLALTKENLRLWDIFNKQYQYVESSNSSIRLVESSFDDSSAENKSSSQSDTTSDEPLRVITTETGQEQAGKNVIKQKSKNVVHKPQICLLMQAEPKVLRNIGLYLCYHERMMYTFQLNHALSYRIIPRSWYIGFHCHEPWLNVSSCTEFAMSQINLCKINHKTTCLTVNDTKLKAKGVLLKTDDYVWHIEDYTIDLTQICLTDEVLRFFNLWFDSVVQRFILSNYKWSLCIPLVVMKIEKKAEP